jgi:hypothetical protein
MRLFARGLQSVRSTGRWETKQREDSRWDDRYHGKKEDLHAGGGVAEQRSPGLDHIVVVLLGFTGSFMLRNTPELATGSCACGIPPVRNDFSSNVFATLKLSHISPFDTRKLSHPGLSPRMVLEDVTSFGLGGRKGCSTWWTWNTFAN